MIWAEPAPLTVTVAGFPPRSEISSTEGSLLYQYQSPLLVVTTVPVSFSVTVAVSLKSAPPKTTDLGTPLMATVISVLAVGTRTTLIVASL